MLHAIFHQRPSSQGSYEHLKNIQSSSFQNVYKIPYIYIRIKRPLVAHIH